MDEVLVDTTVLGTVDVLIVVLVDEDAAVLVEEDTLVPVDEDALSRVDELKELDAAVDELALVVLLRASPPAMINLACSSSRKTLT